MTRLKDATFESNALTGTDAFTTTTGSPSIDSTSLIHGTYCFRTNWASATNMNGTVSGLSATEIWISFYIRVAALPTSGAPRIVTTNNGNTQFNMTLNSSGVLTARNNTTNLSSIRTLSINTTYRVGLHLKVSTGAANADAVYQVYTALGDAAFSGTPDFSSTVEVMNVNNNAFTTVVLGMNNGVATTGDVYWDSLRIDNASMPASDGATDTPMTVSKTVTATPLIILSPTKIFSVTATATVSKLLNPIKPILVTATATVTRVLSPTKLFSATVTGTLGRIINAGKIHSVTVSTTILRLTSIVRTFLVTTTATITSLKDIAKSINQTVTSTLSSVITKNILTLISVTSTVSINVIKAINNYFSATVNITPIVLYGRGYAALISTTVTASVNVIKGLGSLVSVSVVVNVIPTLEKRISLIVSYMVTSTIRSIRNIAIIKSKVVAIGVSFSKLFQTAVGNILRYTNKNVGTIGLKTKNSSITMIGRSRRTITFKDKEDDNS